MPIYAYKCSNCGFEKDALQKMSDAPLTDCPSCGEPALKKQVTAAGFQLKGSGWYVTDFRNGSAPATGTAPGTSKEGKDGGKDTSSDSGKDGASAAKTDSAAPAAASTSSDSKPAAASTPAPSKPAASSGT